MAKAKEGSSLRQRKTDAPGKNEEKAATTKQSVKPAVKSEKGMSCMNWFVVLFLIAGATGAASFFFFGIIQFEMAAIRTRISSTRDIGEQLKSVMRKLETIEQLEKGIAVLKQNDAQNSKDLKELTGRQDQYKTSFENEISDLKDSISALKSSQNFESDLSMLKDQLKVINTDVEQLVKEIARVDKLESQNAGRISSIQQEVINLTADKVAMTTAIESIKSTVVHVRETVAKLQESGTGSQSPELAAELEKKLTIELEQLQRQITETADNSAKWLQTSTNEMEGRFQKSLEDIKKKLADFKTSPSEPGQASADQSVLNSLASLSEKITNTERRVVDLGEIIAFVGENQKKTDASVVEQLGDSSESLSTLTRRVDESQTRDDKILKAVSDVTEECTLLRNDLNSVKTIARILESQVNELRTGQSEKAPEPAQAPDMPADVIPDPEVAKE